MYLHLKYSKRLCSILLGLVVFLCLNFSSKAQQDSLVIKAFDTKIALNNSRSISEQDSLDKALTELVKEIMRKRIFIRTNLDTLKSEMAIQQDKSPYLGLISWSTKFIGEITDSTRYHAHFVYRRRGQNKLYNLVATGNKVPSSQEVLDLKEWYGAIYYKLIPFRYHGKRRFLALGWKETNKGQCKIIEPLSLEPDKLTLGSPKALLDVIPKSREILSYPLRTRLNIKYDYFEKLIYFDDMDAGENSFYLMSPTFRFNGYRLQKKGEWALEKDIKILGL